jgi:hypothetical protein
MFKSSKTEKVADSPLTIDLQLFAEDEPIEPIDPVDPSDPVDPEPSNPEVQAEPPEVADPEPDKPVQDSSTNKAFQEMRHRIEAADRFAKSRGFESFEEMEVYAQQQELIDQGIDPATAQLQVQFNQLQQQIQQNSNMMRIQQDKAKLQGQKYFKDLEQDIDKMLAVNPSINVGLAFEFLKGKKMEELIAKESKAVQQRTLNNMNSKSHIKPDGKSTDNDFIDVDPDEFRIAKALNPKETIESYRAFKKSQRS